MKKLRPIPDPPSAEGPPSAGEAWRATLGDATRAMLDADRRVFLAEGAARLDVIEQARGTILIDRDGREILDFDGSGAHPLGHAHPRVIAAVMEQIEALAFSPTGYTNPPAIALAQRLAELAPGNLKKVVLLASEGAALAAALKIARAATGRHKVLAIGGAIQRGEPGGPGIEHMPALDRVAQMLGGEDGGFARLAEAVAALLVQAGDFAAVIAEPMAYASMSAPPADFWGAVKAACELSGTLLIFDETPVSVGCTGTMFYAEQAGAVPDILVVGKGLGGGIVPVAAVIARSDLETALRRPIGGLMDEKNPVGAAAGLAMLEVIAEDDLLERTKGLGHRSLDHLKGMVERFPIFREARGVGLALGLELAGPGAEERAEAMLYGCLERGLSFRIGGGRVIILTPPLTIRVPEIERAFGILEAVAADC